MVRLDIVSWRDGAKIIGAIGQKYIDVNRWDAAVGAMEAALRLTGRLDEASVAIAAARAEGGSISYDEPVDLGVYDAALEGVS